MISAVTRGRPNSRLHDINSPKTQATNLDRKLHSRSPRTEGDDELTERIIGAAIDVHRILGPGLIESIYEQALVVELGLRGIACQRQLELDVVYKGCLIKGQRLDMLVEGEVIVEIKSLAKVPDVAFAQILSYLKATRLQRACC